MSEACKERLFLVGIIAFACFMYWDAGTISLGRSRAVILPSSWPRMVLGIMIVSALALLGLDVFKFFTRRLDGGAESGQGKPASEENSADAAAETLHYPRRGLYSVLYMLIYVAMIPVAGFVASSIVCTTGYLCSLRHNPAKAVVVVIILTVAITLGFAVGLGVPLPRGSGVFSEFSRILY